MASFTDLINFSRASVGYYWDASGNLVQAAVDTPRFDYTPMAGRDPGLLIEPAVTEENRFCIASTTDYTNVGGAVLTNLTLNALGQFPGLQIASGGSVSDYAANASGKSVPVVAGETRLIEVYYRTGTSGSARFVTYNSTTAQSTVIQGTPGSMVVQTSTAGVVTIVSDDVLRDGLTRRLRLKWVPAASGALFLRVGPNSTTPGNNIVLLGWFTQVANCFTTPIITSGSTFTRAADVVTVKDTGYWFNNAEGSFLGKFRFSYEDTNTGDQVLLFRLNESAYDTPGHTVFIGTLSTVTGRVNYTLETATAATTVQGTANDYYPGYNQPINVGISYEDGAFALCFNGGTVYSGVPVGSMPDLSAYSLTFGGTAPITILSFKHFPMPATAALLQAITA